LGNFAHFAGSRFGVLCIFLPASLAANGQAQEAHNGSFLNAKINFLTLARHEAHGFVRQESERTDRMASTKKQNARDEAC
jgi:hypothetical protein